MFRAGAAQGVGFQIWSLVPAAWGPGRGGQDPVALISEETGLGAPHSRGWGGAHRGPCPAGPVPTAPLALSLELQGSKVSPQRLLETFLTYTFKV